MGPFAPVRIRSVRIQRSEPPRPALRVQDWQSSRARRVETAWCDLRQCVLVGVKAILCVNIENLIDWRKRNFCPVGARNPEIGLLDTVRQGLSQIVHWAHEIDLAARPGLNIVLTDGEHLIGSRFNQFLVHLYRDHVFDCPICQRPHAHHKTTQKYRAVEIASEPVTQADHWDEIPNGKVFRVNEDYGLDLRDIV